MKILIREFRKEDLRYVLRILEKDFQKRIAKRARKDISDGIKNSKKFDYLDRFVAINNSKLIGICGVYRYKNHYPNSIGVAWFAIHPQFQKRGIGKKLLKRAISKARRLQQQFIFVWACKNAVGFYKKFGFKETSRKILPKEGYKLLVKMLS
jgi:N-acetylglutamate synthase-like GNAT family acetyltransferase